MKKILFLLFAFTGNCWAISPYYGTTLSTTTGKASGHISGVYQVAAGSTTYSTYTITLDGNGGNISSSGTLTTNDIVADEIDCSSVTALHGIITGTVAISTDTSFNKGLSIYAISANASADSTFNIQSSSNYGMFSVINYTRGNQGICFDCDKDTNSWGEESRNATSNFMISNSIAKLRFRAASGIALEGNLLTEWKDAIIIDKNGDIYQGDTVNNSTFSYTTGNQAVKSLTVADNSILGGINIIGTKTTGEIQAYSCSGHATNPCVIYNTTNNDLYTSTGTAVSQFKSQLDGSGL